jgi:hypothetical protein
MIASQAAAPNDQRKDLLEKARIARREKREREREKDQIGSYLIYYLRER